MQLFLFSRAEQSGYAIRLELESLSEEKLTSALETSLWKPEMKRKVEHFSALYTDREVSGVETAVWWINYVMRHNGTQFLRPYSLKLYWFQYLGVDIVLLHILLVLLPFLLFYKQVNPFGAFNQAISRISYILPAKCRKICEALV